MVNFKSALTIIIPTIILALVVAGMANAHYPNEQHDDASVNKVVSEPELDTRFLTSSSVTPQMFGAKADGKHDDTEAIKKACSVQADTLFFPKGIYIINIEEGIDIKKDKVFFNPIAEIIIGESRSETVIRLGKDNGDAAAKKGFESIFSFGGKNAHPEIRNITFDFNYKDNPITQYTSNNVGVEHNGQQMAINAHRVSSLVVDSCTFIDHSGTNCIDYRANAESDTLFCNISNCHFLGIGKKSFYKGKEAYHDCSTLALHCDSRKQIKRFVCTVTNCQFYGVGGNAFDACECSADSFLFKNNVVDGYVVGVMPLTSNSRTKAFIKNNEFKSVARGVGIWSNNNDIEQPIGTEGFGILDISKNRIIIDINKFIHRPYFATINKKTNTIYPGGYYAAICNMGNWTKSVGIISITENEIEYKDCGTLSYKEFTSGVNVYNGAVVGFHILFEGEPNEAYCRSFAFNNNTIKNPVSTIIRLVPFNEINALFFENNKIYNCWQRSSEEVKNDGLVSVHTAIYPGMYKVLWNNFSFCGNYIDYPYSPSDYATVFIRTSAMNNVNNSSIQIKNNTVKQSRYGLFRQNNLVPTFSNVIIE